MVTEVHQHHPVFFNEWFIFLGPNTCSKRIQTTSYQSATAFFHFTIFRLSYFRVIHLIPFFCLWPVKLLPTSGIDAMTSYEIAKGMVNQSGDGVWQKLNHVKQEL